MMNDEWTDYPLLDSVSPLPDHHLLCSFRNGEHRRYDFRPHLALPMFQMLREEAWFRGAQADPHGIGVVWNDDMDIAASELWLNGEPIEESSAALTAASNS
jgi:Protein of unknown function (DUF2442)